MGVSPSRFESKRSELLGYEGRIFSLARLSAEERERVGSLLGAKLHSDKKRHSAQTRRRCCCLTWRWLARVAVGRLLRVFSISPQAQQASSKKREKRS